MREDRILKGFKFGEQEVKQVLYADDITRFVRGINSVNRLQYIFDEFEKISGLRINKEKKNFVWLGKEKDKPKVPLFGNLVHEIKILGVYFALDVRIKENMNYKEILSKIKRLLGWWKQRDLTLMGKVHLMKTYALSKLNYISSLIVVPKWVMSEVEKLLSSFYGMGRNELNVM